MTMNFHSIFLKNFSLMLNNADDYDVIIQVGKGQNTKEFHAHSNILRARSQYFKNVFSIENIKKGYDNMIRFNKPDVNPTIFQMILKYIYTGELNLTKELSENIFELLFASDELLLEELFKHVQDYLIEKKSTWIQHNIFFVLHAVFKLANFKKLQEYCFESISADPQYITSRNFLSLDEDILYAFLKRDDLQIEEVIVWDYLIKWGIKQTPDLETKNRNRAKWNNKDYEALKKTLNQFIPLIRFVEISPEDFFDKVRPYEAIIPSHIYEKVEEFYYKGTLPQTTTFPPRGGRLTSRIIKPKLATIIVNWIDRKDSTVLLPNNGYKFNLIYLMSRDGFVNVTFYNKCNGQGPFMVLIRVKSKKIYGGYNPIGYSGKQGQWLTSTKSFVFSFENGKDTHNMKIGRVTNASYSVLDNHKGFFNFGNHLYLNGKNLHLSNSGNYTNVFNNLNTNLPIEEIEVFTVVKK